MGKNENAAQDCKKKAPIKISDMKIDAKDQLKGNIGKLFLVSAIASLFSSAVAAPAHVMMVLSTLIVSPAVGMGVNMVYLGLAKTEGIQYQRLLDGFDNWWLAFKVWFLIRLYSFLWSLLFFIPGIIAVYNYAMTGYILAENPHMAASDALRYSKDMMYGNRWRLFCLEISFIGWDLLNIFTLGIGTLWLRPYKQAAVTAFYREVSGTEHREIPVRTEQI
jgi:uncharacterized membrane protein